VENWKMIELSDLASGLVFRNFKKIKKFFSKNHFLEELWPLDF